MKKKFLLKIICEAALEPLLAAEVEGAGGSGYTAHNVRGSGRRGERSAAMEEDRNIIFQVIGSREFVDRLSLTLQNKYFQNYGMILYIHEVEVLRSEKF